MKPADRCILTINGGSSSIKFAEYQLGEPLNRSLHGTVDRIGMSGTNLTFHDPATNQQDSRSLCGLRVRIAAAKPSSSRARSDRPTAAARRPQSPAPARPAAALAPTARLDRILKRLQLPRADRFVVPAQQQGEDNRLGEGRLPGGVQQRLRDGGDDPRGVVHVLRLRPADASDHRRGVQGRDLRRGLRGTRLDGLDRGGQRLHRGKPPVKSRIQRPNPALPAADGWQRDSAASPQRRRRRTCG